MLLETALLGFGSLVALTATIWSLRPIRATEFSNI